MIVLHSSADLARALDERLLDPPLRRILEDRRDSLAEYASDLSDLCRIVVACPGDTLEAVEAAAEVQLATNPVDGRRLGERGFDPPFECATRHPGFWLEGVVVISDDGFGVVLLVPQRIDVDPRLTILLERAIG